MKQCLSIILLALSGISWGQLNYKPISDTDAVWIQSEFLYGGFHEHMTITSAVYTLGNDTLINGENYTVFGSHGITDWIDGYGSQSQTSGTYSIPYGTGFFRQDIAQKKVFQWNQTNQTDDLLYDFGNLVIGQPYPETFTNLNYPNLLVMGQDSIQLMDGNYYKRWILGTNSSDSGYVSVIEGVGGTNGFNTPIYPVFEQRSYLLCHKVETQHIYEDWQTSVVPPRYSEDCSKTVSIHSIAEGSVNVYPNPTSSIISIRSDRTIQSMEIYDLNGQSLLHRKVATNVEELDLDLSVLEQGSYILKIVLTNGSSATQKIQLIK